MVATLLDGNGLLETVKDDLRARVETLAEHGITSEEFEEVVSDPVETQQSRSSGRPMAFGDTASGKYLACVCEFLDDVTVYLVTAYEVED